MAIDTRRVVEAAVAAAIKELTPPPKPKKRRLSPGRAMLLGAGLATAGRIVAGPKAREMVGRVRERITESDWFGDETPDDIADYDEESEDADYEDGADKDLDLEDEFEDEDEDEEEDEGDFEEEDEEEDEADDESLETERAD